MAKQGRKLKRNAERDSAEKTGKPKSGPISVGGAQAPADPMSSANLKSMALRLGVPVVGVWLIGVLIAGVSQSSTTQSIALGLPAVVTVGLLGVALWGLRQAKKAKGVAGILAGAQSDGDREKALAQLDSSYKSNDPTAIFAKAQLHMQDDPTKALTLLEQIDLKKVMAPIADEARGQRAMIHLMQGQVSAARDLADGIELGRHQDVKSRAMLASVIAESWARSGQGKKAISTLNKFDIEDEQLAQLQPQLYRAQAYACAYTNDTKGMRRSLKKLVAFDARLLGGFMGKKTHPMLQKEAKKMLEQSGQMPRQMQRQRK
ncbi:MAG: hypothetical protein HRU17_20440 [Polyangiaceae bacterium]|nr:hypothetical protein [Polyangiaceae bacterium]